MKPRNKDHITLIINALAELNPEALLADGLDEALIGYTESLPIRAVYETNLCIEAVMHLHEIDEYDAREFLEFNTFCGYVGENGPVFIEVPDFDSEGL